MPTPTRLLTLALALGLAATAFAQPSAQEILDAIVDNNRGGTLRATMTMEVIRPDETTTYTIEIVSDGEAQSLTRVVEPAREAGTATLVQGDNLYLYNQRLGRTLRLPPSSRSDSFLDSDISYNDIGGRDLEENYSAEITDQSDDTVELTLTPADLAPTPYGKVVITAGTADYAPRQYVYFDQRDQAVKRINFDDYAEVENSDLVFPTTITVTDLLEEGHRTVVSYEDYEFGADVPASCFTERALERGCR